MTTSIKEMRGQLVIDANYCKQSYELAASSNFTAETIGFRSDRLKLAKAARDAVAAYAAFLDRSES